MTAKNELSRTGKEKNTHTVPMAGSGTLTSRKAINVASPSKRLRLRENTRASETDNRAPERGKSAYCAPGVEVNEY